MKRYIIPGVLIVGLAGLLVILITFLGRELWVYWLKRPAVSFPLTEKWQVDLGDASHDSPVYQDGLLFYPVDIDTSFGTRQSYWYGLDAATGQIIWSQQVGKQYNFHRCLTKDHLIVSGPWSLLALKPQTGEILWQGTERSYWAIACNERAVFTIVPRGWVSALNISTGEHLWNGANPQKDFSSLVYNAEANEVIALEMFSPRDFYVIDPKSGELQRSFQGVEFPPLNVWQRGVVYVVNNNYLFNGGTVIDTQTGQVIHHEERYALYPPTLTDDTMYLSTVKEGIVALDREQYELQWRYHPPSLSLFKGVSLVPLTQVAILDNIGYVIFSDATLRAFDLGTGQELGYWQPDKETLSQWPFACLRFPRRDDCLQSAMVGLTAANDMLFVSFGDGKLYAFGK